MTSQAELDKVIDQLTGICKPLVQAIEAMTPTTQNHYGDYMSAISRLSDMIPSSDPAMEKKTHIAIGVAMQRAGANKAGVQAALRAMGSL